MDVALQRNDVIGELMALGVVGGLPGRRPFGREVEAQVSADGGRARNAVRGTADGRLRHWRRVGRLCDRLGQARLDEELVSYRALIGQLYGEDASEAFRRTGEFDVPIVLRGFETQRAETLAGTTNKYLERLRGGLKLPAIASEATSPEHAYDAA